MRRLVPGSPPRSRPPAARLARLAAWLLAFFLPACAHSPPPPPAPAPLDQPPAPPPRSATLTERLEDALARATRFLLDRQSADGGWHSEQYGILREGPALAPVVLFTLYHLRGGQRDGPAAYRKGVAYLAAFADEQGQLKLSPGELPYPVYTAAMAVRVLSFPEPGGEERAEARRAWLDFLLHYRLGPELGWRESDLEFGGWGYAQFPPRKPSPGGYYQPLHHSNLTSTLFGLGALLAARRMPSDPRYAAEFGEILRFVERCQNWAEQPERPFDDGGFFFTPTNPVQNKAGEAGRDAAGRERFRSYGAMTCDGLRALLRLGLPQDHPRVRAARAWLESRFSVREQPGLFASPHAELRMASYYYYLWSLAHVCMHLRAERLKTPRGEVEWAVVLAEELLARQRPDGAWVNSASAAAMEDDPLIATPLAASALAICRGALTGEQRPFCGDR